MQKLHPGIKLLAAMLITLTIFFLKKPSVCISLVVILVMLHLIAGIFHIRIKSLIRLSLLAAFIVLVQTYFGGGLFFGFVITCRVFSLMLVYSILIKTTPSYKLAAALNLFGLPYRIAFIISSAFNQVPQFAKEAGIIMDAQKLRGMNVFEKRFSPIEKIKAYAGICLPLVLGAMRKAQVSSVAMDSRAFGVYKTRSWLEKPELTIKDFLFLTGCFIFFILLLFFNYADFI